MTEELIRTDWVDIERVQFALSNPKLHDAQALTSSEQRYGYVELAVINSHSGRLVAGQGRVEALRALKAGGMEPPLGIRVEEGGRWMMEVRYFPFRDDAEAQAYLVDSNNTGLLGGSLDALGIAEAIWEPEPYKDMLVELAKSNALPVSVEGEDLDALLRMFNEGSSLSGGNDGQLNELMDRSDELLGKWEVTRGSLWEAGPHRILCGDGANPEDVAKVMGGRKAELGFAEPPYGKNADEWDRVWNHDYLVDLCKVVVVMPRLAAVQHLMSHTQMPYRWSVGAWISNGSSRGETGSWIYGAVFSKRSHKVERDSTVIDLAVDEAEGVLRKGQRPPRWMTWLCETFTESGDVVFDPFLGSGTTLVGCHRSGRQGYGIESDPRLVSVCLERLSRLGLSPVLVEQPTVAPMEPERIQ